jgi:hypothetical protein
MKNYVKKRGLGQENLIKPLISSKDLKEIREKDVLSGIELQILQQESWKEKQLQAACNNMIKRQFSSLEDVLVVFQQNDNGGSSDEGVRLSKYKQGTQTGFFDVTIWIWTKKAERTIQVEFKKIGIDKLAKKQLYWQELLKNFKSDVYSCNNTVFFERVILNRISEIINEIS